MSSAGMVLSQPPISTAESSGSAFSISSVSIDMRFRSSIEFGYENDSWIEMVGKTNGKPPGEAHACRDFLRQRARGRVARD